MLEIRNISKSYKYKKTTTSIIDDASFSLPDKGLVSFVGKSGEGKTTLFNLLSCLDKVDSGHIIFNGIDLTILPGFKLDCFRAEYISFLFQDFNLLKDENVINNIKYASNKKDNEKEISSSLEKVGLAGFENREIKTLSIGQIQRVALAATIYRRSKILFCDEPTGNLDPETAKEITGILNELSKDILVCMVTHNMELAKEYSDVIYEIKNKKVNKIYEKKTFIPEFNKEPLNFSDCKSLKLGFKKSFKMSFKNLLNSKILSFITLILLIGQLTLFSSVFSFSNFKKEDVYKNTYESSERYVLPLTTVVHNKEKDFTNEYIGYRNSLNWNREDLWISSEDDVNDFKKLYNYQNVASTYTFIFNLRDFSKKSIDVIPFNVQDKKAYSYPSNFYKFHALENFDSFSLPLIKGSLPKNENDILIYDYMENGLKHYGIIDEEESVNKKLHHEIYGLDFNICGVIKSSYQETIAYLDKVNSSSYKYNSYGSKSDDLDTGNILLSELCNVIGFKSFIKNNSNYQNKDIFSCATVEVDNYEENGKVKINAAAVPKTYKVLNGLTKTFDFEYTSGDETGLVLDKKVLMDIAGFTNENEFDNYSFENGKGVEGFLDEYGYLININRIGLSNFTNKYSSFLSLDLVYGITKYGTLNESYQIYDDNLYKYYVNNRFESITNFNYYHPTLILSNDWKQNDSLVDQIVLPVQNKDNAFYDAQPDDFKEHFYSIHDYLNRIVKGSYVYLEKISNFTNKLMVYLTIGTGIVIFLFSFLAIKNNFYKIGVLKSRGLNNFKTTLIFSLSSLLVFLIAFAISIPLSAILVSRCDAIFTETIIGGVTFFKITGFALSISFLTGLGLLLVGIIIPLVSLFALKPIEMIKRNK